MAGVAEAEPSAFADDYQAWLDAGHHGEMAYLENTRETRSNPRKLQAEARSVICVADVYPSEPADNSEGETQASTMLDEPRGQLARYGWGRDYHKVIKKRLHAVADQLTDSFPGAAFRCTTDTAPLFEREYATLAGLGWTGKHTLMINPSLGSWMLLGCIVTDLKMTPTTHEAQLGHGPLIDQGDHCGTCTACIDACPTDAINLRKREVFATRCISYLTLEHRSVIDERLQPLMGDWIGGCDICQEVCPHNRKIDSYTTHPDYQPRDHAAGLKLAAILAWTDDDRSKHLAGTSFMRMKLPMIQRNVLIAAGNALSQSNNDTLRQAVEACVNHADPLVRSTAEQVVSKLDPSKR